MCQTQYWFFNKDMEETILLGMHECIEVCEEAVKELDPGDTILIFKDPPRLIILAGS